MRTAAVCLSVLLGAVLLFALQGPLYRERGPGMARTDQVQAFLELTDQQIKELSAVRSSFLEAAQPLMQQIREKLQAMRDAREQGASSAVLEQAQAELADLQTQEKSLRSQYRVQALAILTDQQKTKLALLQQALDLMPIAGQAAGLNLLDGPPGVPGGPGGASMGGPGFLGGGPPAGRPPRL